MVLFANPTADRVRTWARTKAHGPAPLVAESRRSGAKATRRAGDATAIQAPLDGQSPATDSAADALAPAEDEKQEHPNLAVSFFITIKDILFSSPINLLLVFVPVGIAVKAAGLSAGIIFAMNAIAIIPLAGLLSHATESVARRMGDTIGALMNVTFGNAVELIIL